MNRAYLPCFAPIALAVLLVACGDDAGSGDASVGDSSIGDGAVDGATDSGVDAGMDGGGGADNCVARGDCAPTGMSGDGDSVETDLRGGAGGGMDQGECGPDAILVGFDQYRPLGEEYFRGFKPICARLDLAGAGSGPYTATHGEERELPVQGAIRGAPTPGRCPAGSAVVGFEGTAGLYVDQIALNCAPVEVQMGTSDLEASLGTAELAPPVGGSGGAAFEPLSCPAGMVAVGMTSRSGDAVDAIGLICRAPVLTYGIRAVDPTFIPNAGDTDTNPEFEDPCPEGAFITGYTVERNADDAVGILAVRCQGFELVGPASAPQRIQAVGEPMMLGERGTVGNDIVEMRFCSNREVLTSIAGSNGGGVGIGFVEGRCHELGFDNGDIIRLGSGRRLLPVGTAGSDRWDASCEVTAAVSVLTGHAGEAVDALGAGCAELRY